MSDVYIRGWLQTNSDKGARSTSTVTISKLLLAQLVVAIYTCSSTVYSAITLNRFTYMAGIPPRELCGWLGCLRWQDNRVWVMRLANDGYQLWGWPMMDINYMAGQWWISTIWLANDNWQYVLTSISYVADSWGKYMHVLARKIGHWHEELQNFAEQAHVKIRFF